jgi:PIN like domain
MKFSTGVVDVHAHNTAITNLLADEECIIFLDTNIIFLCFALNDAARNEFFSWLRPLAEQNRIKLPSWCLHEYTSKFNNKQITGSQEENKLISTITKNFEELRKLLSLSVDEAKAQRQGFATIGDFTSAVDSVKLNISKLNNILKIDERLLLEVHGILTEILGPCVLQSNIQQLADECSQVQASRFGNRIPPGYKDGYKPENAIGDLIIWNEILAFSKATSLSKILIISNDEKKDWVYQPYKKLESSKQKPNINPSINLVDTRLVDEFEKYTTINDPALYVVPFNYLFELIIKAAGNDSLDNLRLAIQVAQVSHNIAAEQQSELVTAGEGPVEVEAPEVPVEAPVEVPTPVEQPADAVVEQHGGLSSEAKADAHYEFKSKELDDIVSLLKTSNWYAQNDGVAELYSTLSTTDSADDLFVLGRNIYQAAEGGSFGASDYIRSLGQRVKYLTIDQITTLIEGMVFEAYFNSQGAFRQCKGKPDALPIVVEMLRSNRATLFPVVSKFIKDELGANESQVFYKWFDNEVTDFNFYVVRNESEDDDYFSFYKVQRLEFNGVDLTASFLSCREDEDPSFSILNDISSFFHIPRRLVNVQVEGEEDDVPIF